MARGERGDASNAVTSFMACLLLLDRVDRSPQARGAPRLRMAARRGTPSPPGHLPSCDRHAGERKAHLDAGQRAHQRQVVEVAEVADAEHLAARACRGRCRATCRSASRIDLAQRVGVVAGRHQHRGERAASTRAGSAHRISRPQARTARRVASAWRWWRANTSSRPSSSSSMSSASRRP